MDISWTTSAQTVRHIIKVLKRLIGDVVLFKYKNHEDLENTNNTFLLVMVSMNFCLFITALRENIGRKNTQRELSD
jgi:hypothetical protein